MSAPVNSKVQATSASNNPISASNAANNNTSPVKQSKVGRPSDIGGDLQANSVGANLKVTWKKDELTNIHFSVIHVPWSFVGKMKTIAETNMGRGLNMIDLSEIKSNGKSVFGDDFTTTYKDIFVKRFIPCIYEKFNEKGERPDTFPDDVSEAYRLLVLCELLKAAIKEDAKANLDRLVRSSPPNSGIRPTETAVYQIILSSIIYYDEPAPKGSIQEHVIHRAIEILAGGLPDTLNALEELHQLSCSKGRQEMNTLIFRITAEKAMGIKPTRPQATTVPQSAQKRPIQQDSNDVQSNENARGVENRIAHGEDERVTKALLEIRRQQEELRTAQELFQAKESRLAREREMFEEEKAAASTGSSSSSGIDSNPESRKSNRSTSNINVSGELGRDANSSATLVAQLALEQGLVLEKVSKNSSERIVRINGDSLECKKPGERWSDGKKVDRNDIVNIKVVDSTQKTFLVSTRADVLTLRALSKQGCSHWVSAIENWIKEGPTHNTSQQRFNPDESGIMYNSVTGSTLMNQSGSMLAPSPSPGSMPPPQSRTGSRRFSLLRIIGGVALPGIAKSQ